MGEGSGIGDSPADFHLEVQGGYQVKAGGGLHHRRHILKTLCHLTVTRHTSTMLQKMIRFPCELLHARGAKDSSSS